MRTEYTYNVLGNRLSIRDGNATKDNTQNLTSFTYDSLGRLASESDPLDHTTYYHYDVVGEQVAVVDANGYTTTNQYDDLGRLAHVDYPSSDADVEYQYNALGWRTAMTDAVGVTSWAYDGLGRALTITDPFTGTVCYAYDTLGNRTQLTYPDNKVVQYSYDPLGRMTRVIGWNSQVITYTYNSASEILGEFRPGGLDTSYTYDELGRVTAADYSDGDYYHYSYDAIGNRLNQGILVGSALTETSYEYDLANRLTNVGGVDYTWDDNGNLLDDGVNTYAYDTASRLVAVSNQLLAVSYGYNGLGDRLQQVANSQTTSYTLDLNTGLTQVLSDGTTTYTYGVGRISQTGASSTEYFLGDALGSVRQLVDENPEIVLTEAYDPYGNVISRSGNGSSVYGFAAEQQDVTGLIYLMAR